MGKHLGILYVSYGFLRSMLALPDTTRILGVSSEMDLRAIKILIEHPELPEVAENIYPPTVKPDLLIEYDEMGRQVGVKFKGWQGT